MHIFKTLHVIYVTKSNNISLILIAIKNRFFKLLFENKYWFNILILYLLYSYIIKNKSNCIKYKI